MASSCFITRKYSGSGVLFSFSNVFQLDEALSCGLSHIYQVLLVITCHFKLKKAYGIAIQTQNFRKKKLSKSLLHHILSGIIIIIPLFITFGDKNYGNVTIKFKTLHL